MKHKQAYIFYLRFIIIGCLIMSMVLGANLWFYFQPSKVELAIADWLQFGSPAWLTKAMMAISDSYVVMGLIVGLVCLWSLFTKRVFTAIVLSLSLASLLLIDPIKSIFQRPRPSIDPPIIDYIAGTSFPSGHAFTATILVGSLFLAYILGYRGKKQRLAASLTAIYILLVAWSRVYLHVHYISDVLGGILFGVVVLIILSTIYRWLVRHYLTN
jgi:undecaprenyl-diphosphatase